VIYPRNFGGKLSIYFLDLHRRVANQWNKHVYTESSSFLVSHCVLLLFLSAPRILGSSHSVSTLVWVQWSKVIMPHIISSC